MKFRSTLALAAFLLPVAAQAQSYPERPIRLIVPSAPGGGTDFTARFLGQKVGDALGQTVIVDNRPGAAGNLGVELGAKASPDGYTLVMPITSFSINPSLYRKLPFDTEKDFTPVALAATGALVLVVHPGVQATNVKELIALAKAKPGSLNYANSGNGTSAHLSGEMFKRMAGVDIVSIGYKGGGPAVVDLLAGQVQMYFSTLPATAGQVKSGRLRALAVTSPKRVPDLPGVPTVAESGLPGFEVIYWFGIFAPRGTPAAIVNKLNAEFGRALKLPETSERFAVQGMQPGGGTPAELGAFLRAEIVKWGRVIKEAGIPVQ